jgi:hypothetical protein
LLFAKRTQVRPFSASLSRKFRRMKRAKPYSRSLRPGELSRRYLRIRYGMPPIDGSDDQEAIAVEESWETYDPWDWDCEDDDRLEATLIVAQKGLVAQGSTIAERVINVRVRRFRHFLAPLRGHASSHGRGQPLYSIYRSSQRSAQLYAKRRRSGSTSGLARRSLRE